MKAIWLYLRWLFWNLAYCVAREDETLASYMRKVRRCWWPWHEFLPHAWLNKRCRQWEICLEDASCYTRGGLETIRVEVRYARDDHRVVGLDIFEQDLKFLQNRAAEESTKSEQV